MSELFDELRIMASDAKGLCGADRKKLVAAADEYDRLVAQLRHGPGVQAPPHAALPVGELEPVCAPQEFCTGFLMGHTDAAFTIICGRHRTLMRKNDASAAIMIFEPVVVLTTSPHGAKDLLLQLTDNLVRYEQTYGPLVTEQVKRMSAMQPGPGQRS